MSGSYVLSGMSTQSFECAICLEKYTNPKTLPCGHTFCGSPKRCMKGLENDVGIKCAECREQHNVKEAGLKTNIFIRDVVDQSRRQNTSEASSTSSVIQKIAPSSTSTMSAKPGDMVKFERDGYYHWGICVGPDEVIHLNYNPDQERSARNSGFSASSFRTSGSSINSKTGCVLKGTFSEVAKGCEWSVDNYLDGKYKCGQYFTPLPVDEIIKYANDQSGKMMAYNAATNNCEKFAITCRYGVHN